MFRRCLLVFLSLLFLGACSAPTATTAPTATLTSPSGETPSNITPTGFYWPTGRDFRDDKPGWLYNSCSWSEDKNYITNLYHVGWDISANENDPVIAISDGVILSISESEPGQDDAGWGAGNIGVMVSHQLESGESFIALYAHIRSTVKVNDIIEAGQPFAYIGPYPETGPHLHFGIRPNTTIPRTNWGKIRCPTTAPLSDYNGFVDPYDWLVTRIPETNPSIATITPIAIATRTPPASVPTLTRRPTLTSTITVTSPNISYVGSDGNIWLMQSDGSGKRKLTEMTNPRLTEYSWSPDGTKIALLNYETGNLIPYLLDLSTGLITRLTDISIGSSGLTWSPDGKYIAFSASFPTNTDIYAVSVADRTAKSLTNKPGTGFYRLPAWSPDGKSVAFLLDEDIYILNVGDSSVKNITSGKYYFYSYPYWSRDGNYIGYIGRPVEEGICFEGVCEDLWHYLIRPDGSQVIDLEASYGIDGIPSWSPDGSSAIFVSEQDGNMEVYQASPDLGNSKNLTNSPGRDMAISWSPDGKKILFVSDRSGNGDIYLMDFDGSALVNLTNSSEDETAPQWQPNHSPMLGPIPKLESTPTSGSIDFDPANPENVILWFSTGLKQSNPDIFARIFTEDTILYGTGMAMEGGREEIPKDIFLQELANRLPSNPACIAYTLNPERTLLMIWTKGWQPKWELMGKPTSDVLTFSLSLRNGRIYTTAYFTPDPAILDSPSVESFPCP